MDQTRSSVWMVCKHCPSRPEAKDHTWKQERRCSRWHCLELGWGDCPWAGVRRVGMENPFCPVYTERRVSAEVPLWLLDSLPPKQTWLSVLANLFYFHPIQLLLPSQFYTRESEVPHSSAETWPRWASRLGSLLLAPSPCLWIFLSPISHQDFTLRR